MSLFSDISGIRQANEKMLAEAKKASVHLENIDSGIQALDTTLTCIAADFHTLVDFLTSESETEAEAKQLADELKTTTDQLQTSVESNQ